MLMPPPPRLQQEASRRWLPPHEPCCTPACGWHLAAVLPIGKGRSFHQQSCEAAGNLALALMLLAPDGLQAAVRPGPPDCGTSTAWRRLPLKRRPWRPVKRRRCEATAPALFDGVLHHRPFF